ncbi:MAG: hypothetical protein RLZZ136_211 [Pseudomonadota bacterium]|jgi:thiol-disulfide isomerase/thioredoxin
MLLSRSLKLTVLGLTILAGACDRQSADKAQPPASISNAPGTETPTSSIDTLHKGSPLPSITVSDAAGHTLALASQTGKPLLINLWATWCGPCIAELPQLDALAKAGKLRVVTVSQDMDNGAAIAPFLQQRGITQLEPWLDPQGDVAAHYNANILPTSVLYDAQGHEIWRISGARDWNSAESAALLAQGAQ